MLLIPILAFLFASALVAGGALSLQDASEMIEKIADVISELSPNFGDGRGQAAAA